MQPSTNTEPVVSTTTITCQNGHAVLIKNVSLLVSDDDTPEEDLIFTVDSSLTFGKLVKYSESLPHDMQAGGLTVDMLKKSKKTNIIITVTATTYYCSYHSNLQVHAGRFTARPGQN